MNRCITITLTLAAVLGACGGGDAPPFDESEPRLRIDISPAVLVARHGESVMMRVDVPDVPDADLPSGYAFDLDEVVGKIDVTTAPCPPGAGSRACQDWTITPRAGSVPGTYEVDVRTVGSRVGSGEGAFALTVVAAPAPAHGAAVAVSHFSSYTLLDDDAGRVRNVGHTLVLNDRGEVFALGINHSAQVRHGYVRRDIDTLAASRAIQEPGVVSEFVAAPLPGARWSAIHAHPSRSFALRDDGSPWAWGGEIENAVAASPISGLANVRAIHPVFDGDTFVLFDDGRVLRSDLAGRTLPYCELTRRGGVLGACASGELAQLGNVRALFARKGGDVLFLKNDGTVWRGVALFGAAWQATGLPAIEEIAISSAGVPILRAGDGALWTLDDDDNGLPIAGIDDVAAIAVRRSGFTALADAFALRRDGTLWWWRTNPEESTAPQQVPGLANVVAIADGFAITGDCGTGGALWFVNTAGGAAPRIERMPGFGEGSPACAAPTTVEIGARVVGGGRVVSEPAAIDCGSTCAASFPTGGTVTLHAAPALGWKLSEWRGDAGCPRRDAGNKDRVAFTATSSLACEAVFVEDGERRLSVRVVGEGGVISEPAGLDCGADCTQSYDISTVVTLSATPAPGFGFERFAGHADCADGTLTMDAVKSCVALFAPAAAPAAPSGFSATATSATSVALRWDAGGPAVERYRLERADTSGVFGTIDDAIRGDQRSFLDESAEPNTEYTYRLTAINRRGESAPVTASATTVAGFDLNVDISGSGSGKVISMPRAIDCGSDCSASFAAGSTVLLYADGNFARWEGCDSADGNRCSVTMSGARRVSAFFDASVAPRFLLTVLKQGTGAVVSAPRGIECGFACIADFAAGTVVTLSGSAQFAGANGCDQLVGLQCTVTMDRSRVVVFGGTGSTPPPQFTLTVSVDRAGGFVGSTDGAIGCGAVGSGATNCSVRYASGASIGVYAAAMPGANVALEAWQGDCAAFGAQTNVTLTMTRDMTCRALFVSAP